MAFLDENGVAQFWAAVKDRLADAFNSVEFDVPEQAANLMSGDSIATAFGKLAKNYSSLLTSISDLNTNLASQINTKLNKSDVLANYTTTATGKALDASLGPAIKTKMDLADELSTRVGQIEGRQVKYNLGSVTNPTYHTNVVLTHIVIPANSGRWILLGEVHHVAYGAEVTEMVTFTVDPDPSGSTSLRCISRTTTNNGGGVSTWGYLLNSENERIVRLVTYIYDNITTNYSVSGVLLGFNLG